MGQKSINALADNLLYYRQLKGFTQEELAKKSGVRQNYISRIENGHTQEIYFSRGLALAKALGITAEKLLPIAKEDCL